MFKKLGYRHSRNRVLEYLQNFSESGRFVSNFAEMFIRCIGMAWTSIVIFYSHLTTFLNNICSKKLSRTSKKFKLSPFVYYIIRLEIISSAVSYVKKDTLFNEIFENDWSFLNHSLLFRGKYFLQLDHFQFLKINSLMAEIIKNQFSKTKFL